MTARLVVLASGSGSNLQALVDACETGALDAEIAAVYVNRRKAQAQQRAAAHGIAHFCLPLAPFRELQPDDDAARRAYDAALASAVDEHRPDAVVLAGWMHVLTMSFLERFPGRVINLHPALPGEFPGAHAIDDAWTAHLNEGLDRTGVMIHLVPDEGVDDGPVLASREVPIEPGDTREDLENRVHAVEHELLVDTLVEFLHER